MRGKNFCTYQHFTLGILMLLFLGILCGCQQGSRSYIASNSTASGQAVEEGEVTITAVIKNIDTDNKKLSLSNIQNNEQVTVFYTGATHIWSQKDTPLAISQVSVGEIADITYATDSKEAITVQKNKDTWEKEEVSEFNINREQSSIEINKRIYQYNSDIFVCDAENILYLIDINQQDILTIRGIDTTIYSIEVTQGHGYIRFQGNGQFVDGSLEIGDIIYTTVSENMLVAVREGVHNITMKKDKLVGSKEVKIEKNQEITVDMSGFQNPPKTSNQVRFVITPDEAVLYINQQKVDYSKPITLNYGDYSIRVKSEGYKDYTGVLTVGESQEPVCIDLAPSEDSISDSNTGTTAPSSTVRPTASPSPTSTASSLEDQIEEEIESNTSVSNVKDTAHTITVKTPEGAEVYVNGIYKGIAPVSFIKEIGKLTVKLTKKGYQTRTYQVEVSDDSKDVTYNFSDLVKE